MSLKIVYVVTMYRWGNLENHSYVQGVYTDPNRAMHDADAETVYRGGKYLPDIWTHTVNHLTHKEFNPKTNAVDEHEDPGMGRYKTKCFADHKNHIGLCKAPKWSNCLL